MKFIRLFLYIAFFTSAALFAQTAQENYSLTRIWLDATFTINDAEALGIELEHSVIKPGIYIESTLSETTLRILKNRSVRTENIIENLSEFYRNRALEDQTFLKDFKNDRLASSVAVPNNFKLGSMAGFYTLAEVDQEFAEMREKYPELVSAPEKIGSSIEGRPIYAYRISTPIFTNAKYEVLYTAVHHAREPGGITTLTYFLWDLLERYENGDQEAAYLLEKRELYVIPVINPDGYAFNQTNNPNGGGLWRKNRRKVDNDSYGVDLNRNYGPHSSWDAPVEGSATDPNIDTYRGSAPFSEPETQAVRNFCRQHNFVLALNYHSFGSLLIYPFATKQVETPDSLSYRALAAEFIRINKYAAGTGLQTVGYNVRGDSDEWMYITEDQKKKIYAFTPEVGSVFDGFWPQPSRILPIAQENIYMNYQFAWSAGINIRPQYVSANISNIMLRMNNIGLLTSTDSIDVQLTPLNSLVTIDASLTKLPPLANKAEANLVFPYQVGNGFKNGEHVKIVISTQQNGVSRIDTAEVQLFKKEITELFKNDASEWDLGETWGVVTDNSGIRAFSDSPQGLYEASANNYLQYSAPLELTNISHATLTFKTRWSIEAKSDFAVIQVSTDNGSSWKYLKTARMKNGIGQSGSRQEKNSTGFDGNFPQWTEQEASLDAYVGKIILLRFGLLSDEGLEFDGWYLSDINLVTYDTTTMITDITEENLLKESLKLYPNPAHDELTISNPFATNEFVTVEIVNLLGETVFKSADIFKNTSASISLKDFSAGSYRVILQQNGKEISAIFAVIR